MADCLGTKGEVVQDGSVSLGVACEVAAVNWSSETGRMALEWVDTVAVGLRGRVLEGQQMDRSE